MQTTAAMVTDVCERRPTWMDSGTLLAEVGTTYHLQRLAKRLTRLPIPIIFCGVPRELYRLHRECLLVTWRMGRGGRGFILASLAPFVCATGLWMDWIGM